MAELLEGITLGGRTRTPIDDATYTDVRDTALSNPNVPTVVSRIDGATDTSNKGQRKELGAIATRLRKESTLDVPFTVATGIKLIDGVSVALVQVIPSEEA